MVREAILLEPAKTLPGGARARASMERIVQGVRGAFLYGALDRRASPLDPALRSLVTVRVSQINWCAFCVDINSATLLKSA